MGDTGARLTLRVPAPSRLLKDGLKDSQFSIRYQYLLAALLCCCGKGLREEFDRQCLLVNTLARLAQQVRDAAPSARQVGARGVPGCILAPRPMPTSSRAHPVPWPPRRASSARGWRT